MHGEQPAEGGLRLVHPLEAQTDLGPVEQGAGVVRPGRQGAGVGLTRVIEIPRFFREDPQVVPGIGKSRVTVDGLLERRTRAGRVAAGRQHQAQRVVRLSGERMKRDGRTVGRKRLGEPPGQVQGVTQIVLCLIAVRCKTCRGLETWDPLVTTTEAAQQRATQLQRRRILGVDLERLFDQLQRRR